MTGWRQWTRTRTDFVLIGLRLEVLELLFEEEHTLAPRVGGWGTIRMCFRGREGECGVKIEDVCFAQGTGASVWADSDGRGWHARTLTEDGLGGWFVPEGGECLCGGRGMGKMMREGKEGRGGKADTMAMRIRWRADAIPGGLRAGASARRGQWESWARRWSSLRERLGAPTALATGAWLGRRVCHGHCLRMSQACHSGLPLDLSCPPLPRSSSEVAVTPARSC